MKITLILSLLVVLINQILSQNLCNLKIADNELASVKGGSDLIFDDGLVNDSWNENKSFSRHITSYLNDIEYLYATEFHMKDIITSSHEKITAMISSNDTSIAHPKVQVKGEKDEQLDRSTIEIIYNCDTSKQGVVQLTLRITPDHCNPFSLVWLKVCKEKAHFPKINVGITPKSMEIIKEGVKQNTINVFNPDAGNDKFMITKDHNSFILYLAYSDLGAEKSMQEPHLSYDTNAFQAVITGELSKGGILTNTPQIFTITFACIPLKYTKSDVEVTLKFQNNDVVSLYFQKECETVGELQEFDILYTLYWILIILLSVFLFVIAYYYVEKNRDYFENLYFKLIEKIKIWICSFSSQAREKYIGLNNNEMKKENFYEENDLVDIKIKTDTKNLDSGSKKNFNNFTTDYGGI